MHPKIGHSTQRIKLDTVWYKNKSAIGFWISVLPNLSPSLRVQTQISDSPLNTPIWVWVPFEADLETRIQVQVVYLGGDLQTHW